MGLRSLLLRIPDLVKNKYLASHASQVKALEDALANDRNIAAALQGSVGEAGTSAVCEPPSSTRPTATPSRTVASPDYDGCAVPNFEKV